MSTKVLQGRATVVYFQDSMEETTPAQFCIVYYATDQTQQYGLANLVCLGQAEDTSQVVGSS